MTNAKLMEVVKKSETAERILRMVSERRRNTVYTAFSGLRADLKKRDGKPVDRKEFDEAFKDLAKIGAGRLECSKRGVSRGFHWIIPIRDLGSLLKNQPEAALTQIPSEVAAKDESSKKVTLIIIRRNRKPETIESNESQVAQLRPMEATQ